MAKHEKTFPKTVRLSGREIKATLTKRRPATTASDRMGWYVRTFTLLGIAIALAYILFSPFLF